MSRSSLAAVLAVALLATVAPVTAAAAAPAARDIASACPALDLTRSPFGDVRGTHVPGVACVARWGVTQGVTPTRFDPDTPVTREQVGSFLARVLDATGGELPPTAERAFADTRGSTHRDAVDRLAAVGVMNGVGGRYFDPRSPVRRDQMASMLVRAFEHLAGRSLPDRRQPVPGHLGQHPRDQHPEGRRGGPDERDRGRHLRPRRSRVAPADGDVRVADARGRGRGPRCPRPRRRLVRALLRRRLPTRRRVPAHQRRPLPVVGRDPHRPPGVPHDHASRRLPGRAHHPRLAPPRVRHRTDDPSARLRRDQRLESGTARSTTSTTRPSTAATGRSRSRRRSRDRTTRPTTTAGTTRWRRAICRSAAAPIRRCRSRPRTCRTARCAWRSGMRRGAWCSRPSTTAASVGDRSPDRARPGSAATTRACCSSASRSRLSTRRVRSDADRRRVPPAGVSEAPTCASSHRSRARRARTDRRVGEEGTSAAAASSAKNRGASVGSRVVTGPPSGERCGPPLPGAEVTRGWLAPRCFRLPSSRTRPTSGSRSAAGP